MLDNTKRNGNFTSSEIHRLCGFDRSGKKPSAIFYSYVNEKHGEIDMNRSIKVQDKSKTSKWGLLMEVVLFNHLGLNYAMKSQDTIVSDKYEHFSGTPDLISEDKIGEIKCYYPLKFYNLTKCLLKKDVELLKKEFKAEYWQCVSNAILADKKKVELITFMPKYKELIDIIIEITETDFLTRNGLEEKDFYFILNDDIETLPYLPDDSKMESINRFEFEVPKEDVDFLLERIEMANLELTK